MQNRRGGAFLKWRLLPLAVGASSSALSVTGEAAPFTGSPVVAKVWLSGNVIQSESATKIGRYAPFAGGKIATGIKVARTASGYCPDPSNEDSRRDAYICTVGSVDKYIYDPCFADKTDGLKYVVCPLYEPDSKVLRVNLTLPLQRGSYLTRSTRDPWLVQTADGTWCKYWVGRPTRVVKLPITYLCLRGSKGFILGKPRRGTTWTAFFAPGFKVVNRPSGSYRRINLASAWW